MANHKQMIRDLEDENIILKHTLEDLEDENASLKQIIEQLLNKKSEQYIDDIHNTLNSIFYKDILASIETITGFYAMGWYWFTQYELEEDGKWIVTVKDIHSALSICVYFHSRGINCKCSTENETYMIICIYSDSSNIELNKVILRHLFTLGAIPKNKDGRYKNISFKFDEQTSSKEYGTDFHARITLEDYVNRYTGEFIK